MVLFIPVLFLIALKGGLITAIFDNIKGKLQRTNANPPVNVNPPLNPPVNANYQYYLDQPPEEGEEYEPTIDYSLRRRGGKKNRKTRKNKKKNTRKLKRGKRRQTKYRKRRQTKKH
jgi:hypothetical protein